jgi:hypothetical protein
VVPPVSAIIHPPPPPAEPLYGSLHLADDIESDHESMFLISTMGTLVVDNSGNTLFIDLNNAASMINHEDNDTQGLSDQNYMNMTEIHNNNGLMSQASNQW